MIAKKLNKIVWLTFGIISIFLGFNFFGGLDIVSSLDERKTWWDVQSVDTMKFSRDLAKEKLKDQIFDREIDAQVSNIAKLDANYIAIATPYDEEFVPYLMRWVKAARKYNLRIWFRGNWSGWEGWFDHKEKISFDEHINKSKKFILDHPDLFKDGDSFTACPECENGKDVDPRKIGQVDEYRVFLIKETEETKNAFDQIHKKVYTNWLSMNKDVADLVMDRETTAKIGGLIVIDHYVKDPKILASDVDKLVRQRGAKIMLGEFGAPIDNITGNLDEIGQSEWLNQMLRELIKSKNLYGLNYWVNKGGGTAIFKDDNNPKQAVSVLKKFYQPAQIYGTVKNDLGRGLKGVTIANLYHTQVTENSNFVMAIADNSEIRFSKDGYQSIIVKNDLGDKKDLNVDITLKKLNPSWWYRFLKFFL